MTTTPADKAYEALIHEARTALRLREPARAEHLAREALSHDPQRAAAYNLLAAVRELQGHHGEAMDFLRAGIAVEPTYRPAQKNLARLSSPSYLGDFMLGDEEQ